MLRSPTQPNILDVDKPRR